MPFKFETQHLKIPYKLDRRRKLDECDKEIIRQNYGLISQRQLAKVFGVSRSTIRWIGDPEKLIANKKRREERGGWRQYYDLGKHKIEMQKTRKCKTKLMSDGKLL